MDSKFRTTSFLFGSDCSDSTSNFARENSIVIKKFCLTNGAVYTPFDRCLKINKEIQMLRKRIKGKIVGQMTIILASILLFGVLAMSYGYFQKNMHWVYFGLPITLATSFTMIFQSIIPLHFSRSVRTTKRG